MAKALSYSKGDWRTIAERLMDGSYVYAVSSTRDHLGDGEKIEAVTFEDAVELVNALDLYAM